jgi:uncharacterized membrane protein
MKKYLKVGLGVVIPVALVLQIGLWLISITQGFFESLLGFELAWWGVLLSALATVVLIIVLGFVVAHSKLIRDTRKFVEKQVIDKTPLVRPIYNFGREVVDTFITDVKEDGELTVIEVDFGSFQALGVLTDEENGLGFLLSAPSPLTGFVFKLPKYRKLDMSFIDAVKINTSLGRVNGGKWK